MTAPTSQALLANAPRAVVRPTPGLTIVAS